METLGRADDLCVALVTEPLLHRVPGGTGRATEALAAGLVAAHGVGVIGLTAAHPAKAKAPLDRVALTDQRSWRLPRAVLYESWARTGRPGAGAVAPEAQLLHSPMLPAPARRRVPLVVTLHDLAFIEEPAATPPRPRRLYERLWERVRDDADLVICSSRATFDVAVANGLEASRGQVVPLGATVMEVSDAAVARTLDSHDLREPYVLSVGTAEPRKNLAGLLDAYAASGLAADGVELVVVGPAGWNETLSARVAAMDPGVASKVRLLGEVADQDLHGLYRGAMVFAYPSLLEGFGLPVVEAMAHGTPVITSATTSTAEIAGDAGVLIDPRDVESIAAALTFLVGDASRRQELSERGRRRAREFTWSRHIDATVAIYRELVA